MPNPIESGTDHKILADHASRYLGKTFDLLSERERSIVRRLIERRSITHDTNQSFDEKLPTERMADKVAEFGGSWTFIVIFAFVLLVWVTGNIAASLWAFDPYPFIFLNLVLSMLAAVQAPVIMMSQNRYAAKDRLAAAHDYEVNLKAEIEIMALHDKLDQNRNVEIRDLFARQQEQLTMLADFIGTTKP